MLLLKSRIVGITLVLVLLIAAFQGGRRFGLWEPRNENTEDTLVTAYYPVQDLVTRWKGAGHGGKTDFDVLITLLEKAVAPDSWAEHRVITPMEDNRLLAITQTKAIHSEIEQMFSKLREPVSHYYESVSTNVCMHCNTAPMPKVGEKCQKCDLVRCAPIYDMPHGAVLRGT